MRKFKYYLIGLIIIMAGISVWFLKGDLSKETSASAINLEPVSKNVNGINLIIDPRIELLAAVQTISSYDERLGLLTYQIFSYKNDMKNYFSKFSKHEAVKTFNYMSSTTFSYDAPPTAMLYLSNPLNLKVKQDFNVSLKNRVGESGLNKFAGQINKFAIDTRFDKFFNKHKDFYKSVVEKNAEVMGNNNYIDALENYYGMKQNSYNIILAPMFHNGGYGPRLENEEGSYDVYSIQGPASVHKNIPIFGTEYGFRYIALHEFSHSFVNPITEENRNEVNKYSKLFTPISEKMNAQAYSNWETCVNEHIVRAVVARLTYLQNGKVAYDDLINQEKKNGFFYIGALTEKLEVYENNRDKYKSIKEFYTELLKVFKELNEKDLGQDFYTAK